MIAASRIAGPAVVAPVPGVDGVELAAVAARHLGRARDAAERWGAPAAFGSYAELIASDDIDAVYIGTPHSLHRQWAVAAIEAGKHVLCEKPLAANTADAQCIADAAAASDVVVMEAYHWRYHPFAAQIHGVVDSGVLGRLLRVEARFDLAAGLVGADDFRWDLRLGGGALMDLGCYPLQWVRFVAGDDPEVVGAEAVCPVAEVDGALTAELRWPSGVTGTIHASMIAETPGVIADLVVSGESGVMTAVNPLGPQHGASLVVESAGGRREYDVERTTTYHHQLVAFREAIVHGAPFPTTAADGVRMMELIDDCYRAAGLQPRPAHG